jgi:EAL and modified HD-GYP domain-containing signal transduction protein
MPRSGPAAAQSGDVAAPDVFVARQPILTSNSQVVGYELLYRSAVDPHLVARNPQAATGHVLATAFFAIGLDELVGSTKAWINFPKDWLIEGVIGALPADRVVIEILQSVEVDDQLVETIGSLKSAGFAVALDGLIPNDRREPIIDLVDYAKVDVTTVDEQAWPALVARIKAGGTQPLALRVEDWLDLERAAGAGFELFQGYYLTKPNLMSGTEVPILDSTRLLALKVASNQDSTLEDVEHVVETDAGLAFRLLRYLNAASFGFRDPVTTIHQAVVRLGKRGARTWLLLATINALGKDRPLERISVSAIRAHMCQRIALVAGHHHLSEDAFMAGLFLNIDATTGMPMSEILESVTLPDSVAAVLQGDGSGLIDDIVHLAVAYEGGVWGELDRLTDSVGIAPSRVASEYVASIDRARESLSY